MFRCSSLRVRAARAFTVRFAYQRTRPPNTGSARVTRRGRQHNVHTPTPGLLPLRRSQAKEHKVALQQGATQRGSLSCLSLAHAKHTRFGS